MYDISVTKVVFIFNKLIDINELHPLNNEFILITDEVLRFNKLIDFNELHPLNIEDI